jgi:hypothetical protein
MEAQKIDAQPKEAQTSFGEAFLQRKDSVPRAGFEPKAFGDIPRKLPFFLSSSLILGKLQAAYALVQSILTIKPCPCGTNSQMIYAQIRLMNDTRDY